ncbi:hypothetical protein EON64_17540, partial [archaeon]
MEATLHLPSGPSPLLERLIEVQVQYIENPRIRHPEAEGKEGGGGEGPKGLSPLDKRPPLGIE